jgi:cytoskeletal protein RodZ
MPEKQKARSWKELQTMIAAACMLVSFALCNIIASFERHEDKTVNPSDSQVTSSNPQSERRPEDAKLATMATQAVTSTGSS